LREAADRVEAVAGRVLAPPVYSSPLYWLLWPPDRVMAMTCVVRSRS